MVLATLFNSALLAGVVGLLGNYCLIKQKANLDLEVKRIEERRSAYSDLAIDVRVLRYEMDDLVTTAQVADELPNPELIQGLDASLAAVADQLTSNA